MPTSALPNNPIVSGGGSLVPPGFNPSGFTNEQLAAAQAGGAIPFTRPGGGSSLFYGTGLETPEQRMQAFQAMMANPGNPYSPQYAGAPFDFMGGVKPVDYSGTRPGAQGATPAIPATPAVPGVSPAVPATPATPPWMQTEMQNPGSMAQLWRAQQLIAAAQRARSAPGAAASSSAAPQSYQGGMTGGFGWGQGGTQMPGPPPGVMARARAGFQGTRPYGGQNPYGYAGGGGPGSRWPAIAAGAGAAAGGIGLGVGAGRFMNRFGGGPASSIPSFQGGLFGSAFSQNNVGPYAGVGFNQYGGYSQNQGPYGGVGWGGGGWRQGSTPAYEPWLGLGSIQANVPEGLSMPAGLPPRIGANQPYFGGGGGFNAVPVGTEGNWGDYYGPNFVP